MATYLDAKPALAELLQTFDVPDLILAMLSLGNDQRTPGLKAGAVRPVNMTDDDINAIQKALSYLESRQTTH